MSLQLIIYNMNIFAKKLSNKDLKIYFIIPLNCHYLMWLKYMENKPTNLKLFAVANMLGDWIHLSEVFINGHFLLAMLFM